MSTEDELGRALHTRADDVAPVTLSLRDVRGRARTIRRRQAAGTVAALAVVAVAVVPVSLLVGRDHPRSPEPAPRPTQGVDPSRTTLPTLQDGVIIDPDGPRIPLSLADGTSADGFAQLGDDRYVVTLQTGDGRREAAVVGEAGVAHTYPLNGSLAASSDHEAVAWVDEDGATRLLTADADRPRTLAAVTGADPTAVAITGHCSSDCAVVVRVQGERGLGPSWSVSSDGRVDALPGGVPAVEDASQEGALLAGVDGIADDDIHACGGVYDVPSAAFLWHRCEDNTFDFSPAGSLVATTFSEGAGPTRIDLRDDRTGESLAHLEGGLVTSWAWEDDRHLLVVQVEDSGATSVQRLGLEGRFTVLDGFHTDPDTTPAVILPSQ